MSFANPIVLYLLFFVSLLPVMFIFSERNRKRRLAYMVSDTKRSLVMGSGFERRLITMILLCLGLAMLIIGAARPRWGTKLETITHRGIDILIAVDVSESMRARDVSPNRIAKARQEISQFLNLLAGDRVGLIAFAGSAFTYCPLTVDYSAVSLFLNGLEPGVISDGGTDISAAIEEGIKTFKRSKSNTSKVLVLFTDGEHHEKDPIPAVREALAEGIRVFAVGIGNVSKAGERIPVSDDSDGENYKLDQLGNLVITRLDEATLMQIAAEGDGEYYRVSEAGTELIQIYETLSQQEEAEFSSRIHHQKEERFQIPLLAAIALLTLAFSLGNRSFRKLRRTQGVKI